MAQTKILRTPITSTGNHLGRDDQSLGVSAHKGILKIVLLRGSKDEPCKDMGEHSESATIRTESETMILSFKHHSLEILDSLLRTSPFSSVSLLSFLATFEGAITIRV